MSRFYYWLAMFSAVIGCGIIWPAIWKANLGTMPQRLEALPRFIGHMPWWEQTVLFITTPFASALFGGLIVGTILGIFIITIWEATLGKLFR
jgi:hypothetical protein